MTRIQKTKKTSEVIKNKGIKIQSFLGSSSKGLSNIKLKPKRHAHLCPKSSTKFHGMQVGLTVLLKTHHQIGLALCKQSQNVPICKQKSSVSFLPIIDLNPSDESCIYSTQLFTEEQAKLLNVNIPCITYNQPLWLKATGIINDANLNIACRLGGFHTLMSFLGSVGNMMKGSGLEGLFTDVYAEHSAIHMMSGKAFSTALHAHFLTESAVMTLILTIIKASVCFYCVNDRNWGSCHQIFPDIILQQRRRTVIQN